MEVCKSKRRNKYGCVTMLMSCRYERGVVRGTPVCVCVRIGAILTSVGVVTIITSVRKNGSNMALK